MLIFYRPNPHLVSFHSSRANNQCWQVQSITYETYYPAGKKKTTVKLKKNTNHMSVLEACDLCSNENRVFYIDLFIYSAGCV